MYCEMPDHPAASWSVGKSVAVALNVEKPNDLASVLSHELDSRLVVALLLALDRVEERGVEERQHAAPQPSLLVALGVWANHDAHGTSLAGKRRAIKPRTVRRTEMRMLQGTFPHAWGARPFPGRSRVFGGAVREPQREAVWLLATAGEGAS